MKNPDVRKCPNCAIDMPPGWVEPDRSCRMIIVGSLLAVALGMQVLLAGILGVVAGYHGADCNTFLPGHVQVLLPEEAIGCRVGKWLQGKV